MKQYLKDDDVDAQSVNRSSRNMVQSTLNFVCNELNDMDDMLCAR